MSLKVPLELLDIIIGHITETSDLLSFGLTCKFVADIIFPYHLHYHTISAPIRKSHLWTFLSLNPRLCRYIRRLEVIDFHNPKMRLSDTEYEETKDVHPVPTDSSSAVLWSYEAFFRALREMINLKVFKWLHNETPILHSEGSIAKELPNLNFRGRMSGSPFSFRDIVPGHYASIFDTSVGRVFYFYSLFFMTIFFTIFRSSTVLVIWSVSLSIQVVTSWIVGDQYQMF